MGSKSSKLDGEPKIRQSVLDNVKGHIVAHKEGFYIVDGARELADGV